VTFVLDPALPVLLRPDGAVQVGWDPRRAVLVRPPSGLTAAAMATVLRAMAVPTELTELHRLALRHGLDDEAGFDDVLYALLAVGVVRERTRNGRAAGRTLSIRVHGSGPLSELVADGLRCSGARVGRSSHANAAGAPAGVDLMVLADTITAEPRLLRELHAARVPHLPVRLRDHTGLVGPLVIPGVTSCLGCADLHRTDRDAAWPVLAVQLREAIAHADRPTLLATAALALGQLQQIIGAVRGIDPPGDPPATMNATVEVDIASHTIRARRWTRHPLCGCWHPRTARAARRA
jgi:bacteriocin biosynthesis cyclodehydratase domain-containing protein